MTPIHLPFDRNVPGAQLELAFHITLKFLDLREQPYGGNTVQIGGEERGGKD